MMALLPLLLFNPTGTEKFHELLRFIYRLFTVISILMSSINVYTWVNDFRVPETESENILIMMHSLG